MGAGWTETSPDVGPCFGMAGMGGMALVAAVVTVGFHTGGLCGLDAGGFGQGTKFAGFRNRLGQSTAEWGSSWEEAEAGKEQGAALGALSGC